jgi:uncharacterized protein YkwD
MKPNNPVMPSLVHRKLSWLGAFVLFVAVVAGTVSVLRPHVESAPKLTASQLSAGVATAPAAVTFPSPSPGAAPTLKPAPAPAKAAAPVSRPAPPAIVVRSTQQALINMDRARYGLRPLTWSSCLASIAYSNAYRMARQGYISHTDGATRDLGCRLGNRAGENVGWWSGGVNDAQINSMFMYSADQRANILGPYHYVATAWVTAPNGYAYIAVEFS